MYFDTPLDPPLIYDLISIVQLYIKEFILKLVFVCSGSKINGNVANFTSVESYFDSLPKDVDF